MASLKDVGKVLAYLAALYPRYELKVETVRAYHTIVADIEPGLLHAAAIQVASTSKWFPAASELRGAALEIQSRAQGIPSAAEAWREVLAQVGETGSYGVPAFSRHLTSQAVDALGGWRSLCASDNLVADRAHFFRIYEDLLRRQQEELSLLPQVREAVARLAAGEACPVSLPQESSSLAVSATAQPWSDRATSLPPGESGPGTPLTG
jgi:hypothetical protein